MSAEAAAPLADAGAVTVYHLDLDEDTRDLYHELWAEDRDLDAETFRENYVPAETVLGTTDLGETYHRAQGEVVNDEQGGRHMVHSAMPTDVFEVRHPHGRTEAYMVERIGFERLFFSPARVLGLD